MKSLIIALPHSSDETVIQEPQPALKRLREFFKQYGLMLILTCILLMGVAFGIFRTVSESGSSMTVADKFLSFVPDGEKSKTPVMIFADSFSVSFIFAAALCFFALTPSGIPAIPAVIFFRGYEFGIAAGSLCLKSGFSGMAYYISVILAGEFLSSIALLYYSQYALSCAASMLLAVFGQTAHGERSLRERFKELIMNGAYCLILVAFASLTDTVLYLLIGRLFVI